MIKNFLKKYIMGTSLEAPLRRFLSIQLRIRIINFIFQRIFRINGKVPWSVHYTSIVHGAKHLKVAKNSRKSFALSGHFYIQALNGVEIGEETIFAPGVKILSTNHDEATHASTIEHPIKIGAHCWLGANAVILPGVELGNNVVVAAGAVVTKSFPSNVVLAGVPAKILRQTHLSSDD
ncbi:MAG: acyltransferase [Phycisphaerae bacterium]|nr:acyltransferase [Phycisphaerae bacterium]